MDDILCSTQGGAAKQQRVSELTLRYLKEIFPSIPGYIKDSDSLKKALARDGDLRKTKDILVRFEDNEKGGLLLSSKCKDKLLSFIDPHTHVAAW